MIVRFSKQTGETMAIHFTDEASANEAIAKEAANGWSAVKDTVKEDRLAALRAKHLAMKASDLTNLVQLRDAVLELQEILGLK